MSTSWIFLILAGLFEMGWPVGLKMAQAPGKFALGLVIATVGMLISGTFLYLAQKNIPIGTAYAVWTGIGAAGTFLIGVFFYGDATSMLRILAVALIIGGVILLKLAH